MDRTPSVLFFSKSILILCLLYAFTLSACRQNEPLPDPQEELLIYCGITMIKPILELASIFEKQEDVKLLITKGGSGNLMKSFLFSQTGDLYLPGSDKYFTTLAKEHPGVILQTVLVGHNKAALMVQQGNPLRLNNDLKNMTNPDYAIVIGNPNSGSIGKETKNILERYGIYEEVVANAMLMTTDSKDLSKLLVNKEADIVINWYAVSTWDENIGAIDTIEIDPEFAETKQLKIGLLRYSSNRRLAEKFMQLASSEQGKTVFKKHGLYFDH